MNKFAGFTKEIFNEKLLFCAAHCVETQYVCVSQIHCANHGLLTQKMWQFFPHMFSDCLCSGDCNGTRTHNHLVRNHLLDHLEEDKKTYRQYLCSGLSIVIIQNKFALGETIFQYSLVVIFALHINGTPF